MFALPRRWIRQLGYLLLVFFITIVVLLVANRNNVGLNDYLPTGFLPSFFQPAADLFIVDIAIKNCFKMKSKNENCGLPGASEGLMGNLYGSGQWLKIDKDLSLGSSWYRKEYFSYKKAKKEALQGNILTEEGAKDATQKRGETEKNNQVIVDVAISNPLIDAKIPENDKLNIPMYILKEFHSEKVYDDGHHDVLVEKQKAKMKGEKLQALTVDKDKSASNKINIKLEQDRQAAESANRGKDKENELIKIDKIKGGEDDEKNQEEKNSKSSSKKKPEEKDTQEKENTEEGTKDDIKDSENKNKEKVIENKKDEASHDDKVKR